MSLMRVKSWFVRGGVCRVLLLAKVAFGKVGGHKGIVGLIRRVGVDGLLGGGTSWGYGRRLVLRREG